MKFTRNHLPVPAWDCLLLLAVLAFSGGCDSLAAEQSFAWQQDYARVTDDALDLTSHGGAANLAGRELWQLGEATMPTQVK